MTDLKTLQEKYQEIQSKLSEMSKQKNGIPYHDLRIDNEMDTFRDERYNLYVAIQLQKVKDSHICDYFPGINPKNASLMIEICETEGKDKAISQMIDNYPFYNHEWFSVIYGLINS